MIKYEMIKMVKLIDWDNLVKETYSRPYSFQQQDGCQGRGIHRITIPDLAYAYDYENDTIPEEVNGEEMGVSFASWLARDVNEWSSDFERKQSWILPLFWHRNFYPTIQMVANDLHAKVLIEAGDYIIEIDW